MLREKLRNKKGFTLIEIIVVIVILAVLMAVAVPSVMSYMNEGQKAKYQSVARTVLVNAQTEYAKAVADGKSIADATKAAQDATDSAGNKHSYGEGVTVASTAITTTPEGATVAENTDVASVTCNITIDKKMKTGVKITPNKKVEVPDATSDAK
ncbi:MAG: prepilin-type N-terminal cleavage/methylation domain-containing protein [Ruminococcus sp.]|nr:prepilin-type N-terminal cleavage/methylation domain-containing protein [Ruminococcus sp.]MDD6531535.1 prepilin-type N-terminal cleavage/methylation domain-containing protein [Ruminococcus sp.]